ncbi:RecX family transcriptional regulator [Alkalibacter rhizosphaerae]|uniref:Regulatory protein RecX n=1 Tax=Alkalibacter rhizosphaerae TaxID=2815577 RepID=A0A974XEI4_9FIRM|nr:RecX family transcriptional regulator [Alkalibacter rhizosphaerae]QSX08384.1 RecX family transcriptional regulator [Alkalibacter rhizosphaerae]
MKTITELKIDKKTKQVQIYSGEEWLMDMDPELVWELGLKNGSVLEEEELLVAKRKSEEKKAYNQSLHYLTFKDRTVKEVKDHLKDKGHEPVVITVVMKKLKEYGFVDDQRYAAQYVKDKSSFSDLGRNRISADLEKRGISKEQSLPYLEEYCCEGSELEKAKDLAVKLDDRFERLPYRQKVDKIGRRLQDKGYSWDVIQGALAGIDGENKESVVYQQELEKNLHKAVEKNKRKKLDDRTFQSKVAQQLMRKGYAWDEVQEALRRLDTQVND